MSELFSKEWGQAYKDEWNGDEEITSTLNKAGFNSIVAFGLYDEDAPRFVMTIEGGFVTSIDDQPEDVIEWDIRATQENWLSLVAKPPGLMKLGIAYTSRKIRFKKGDYATMVKDPSLAGAFVKSFGLMSKIT
ncbi:MAG: SCP-2 sterol transfer family protein [Gammaproteobacteria bacterium]|nr:SCP-2 sterol transfer family protein [Gammaproteobacteria bacterium]MCK5262946.1 SCP-2 sterol transfer family protein [Gammaproteobacteria bacterium]